MRLLILLLGGVVVCWLIWALFFNGPEVQRSQPFAFPAGAAAALLDGRPRHGEEGDDPDVVLCLSVSGRQLAEILPLRRHNRSTVVDPQECVVDPSGEVTHRPTGARAALFSFGNFQPTGTELGTAEISSMCGPECGGIWTVELSGADDIGWWVVEEKNVVIY